VVLGVPQGGFLLVLNLFYLRFEPGLLARVPDIHPINNVHIYQLLAEREALRRWETGLLAVLTGCDGVSKGVQPVTFGSESV